jgi:hypothetical protein
MPPEWLKELGTWLTLGASLISVGIAIGSVPRIRKDLDDHQDCDRAEKDHLWREVRDNERALAKFREQVAEKYVRKAGQ